MSLSEIYSKSFKIVRKHKVLWVFGVVIAALSGSSAASFSNSFNRSGNFADKFGGFNQSSISGSLSNASSELQPLFNIFNDYFKAIPTSTWIMLGLAVFTTLVFGIIFALLIRSWAEGSLIGGTYDALDERNEVSFASVSYRGRKSFKSLAALYFFPNLIMLLIFAPFIVLMIMLFASNQVVLGRTLAALTIITAILASIIISVSTLWGERIIAIEHLPWTAAFWQGLKMFREHFLDTIKLGCSNLAVGCGSGCLLTIIVIPIIGVLVLIGIIPLIGWLLIPVLLLIAIIVLSALGLASSLILTFKYTTWSVLYKHLKEESHA